MPQSGRRPQHQKRKSSERANVFRFAPESRHRFAGRASAQAEVVPGTTLAEDLPSGLLRTSRGAVAFPM